MMTKSELLDYIERELKDIIGLAECDPTYPLIGELDYLLEEVREQRQTQKKVKMLRRELERR